MVRFSRDCQIAASALGYKFWKTVSRWDRPAGCFWDVLGKKAYLNQIRIAAFTTISGMHVGGICKRKGNLNFCLYVDWKFEIV